jgi:CheY-like chemotaxis protein
LQIVCEVSNGSEAVRKAQELQPDLILLDIGLPSLNGIAVAWQVRRLSPESRILFLSLESDADIVREALNLGALGYVLKKDAGRDLGTAVEAVCQGRRFVSSSLSHHNFVGALDAQTAGPSLIKRVSSLNRARTRNHEAEFYLDDASFVIGLSRFVKASLEAGSVVIILATKSHRESLVQQLQQDRAGCAAAIQEGRYIAQDAAETLAAFMVNGLPDPVRFRSAAGDLVASAARAANGALSRVAACGECAPLLWAQGNPEAAVQLEHLWDELAREYAVDILCGYLPNSQSRPESYVYQKICAEHSAVSSRWIG